MSDYRFFQIDAFAEQAMAGGPAGVMPVDVFPAAEVMQAIAAENNLAETAFIVAKAGGAFDLRWFTPAVEVPLCGHATLASAHALYAHLGFDGPEIGFDTKSGRLTVKRLADGRLEMDFPADMPKAVPASAGRHARRRAGRATCRKLGAGPYLMAVFRSAEDVIRALKPDLAKVDRARRGKRAERLLCGSRAVTRDLMWFRASSRPQTAFRKTRRPVRRTA